MTCNTSFINKVLTGNISSYTDRTVMSLLSLTPDIHYLAFIKTILDYNELLILSYINKYILVRGPSNWFTILQK